MKNLLLLLILFPSLASAQWFYDYPYYQFHDFEDTTFSAQLYIDTVSNPSSLWQVGEPNKVDFNSAYSGNNAMITDTVNSYPINDTSSFIIWHEAQTGFEGDGTNASIEGWYWVNSDSLNDYGKIEFSFDHGVSWILVSDDTTTYSFGSSSVANWPTLYNTNFTGNSSGWQYFMIEMSYGVLDSLPISYGDTLLFKFSFISDGNFDGRDGLMFDDLEIKDWFAFGIDELGKNDLMVYPNPTSEILYLENNVPNYTIGTVRVLNELGQEVLSQQYTDEEIIKIDCSNLTKGLYILKVESANEEIIGTGRFVVD